MIQIWACLLLTTADGAKISSSWLPVTTRPRCSPSPSSPNPAADRSTRQPAENRLVGLAFYCLAREGVEIVVPIFPVSTNVADERKTRMSLHRMQDRDRRLLAVNIGSYKIDVRHRRHADVIALIYTSKRLDVVELHEKCGQNIIVYK